MVRSDLAVDGKEAADDAAKMLAGGGVLIVGSVVALATSKDEDVRKAAGQGLMLGVLGAIFAGAALHNAAKTGKW